MATSTKQIRITSNGYVWEFSAHWIAHNRATYYAERDKDTTYEREYEHTMNHDYELADWFGNNMDWEDVAFQAKIVTIPERPTQPDHSADDYAFTVR